MPLDEFLPEYEFSERHSTRIAASPATALAAARELDARDLRLTRALLWLRRLRRVSSAPVLEQMRRQGFVLLADRPEEVVLGALGRFWRFDSGLRAVEAEEFTGFRAPGHTKAVIDFRALPAPGGCVLSTETRIHCTDDHARRSFGRYWRVVQPGSALIRREWLRAIRRRAESG